MDHPISIETVTLAVMMIATMLTVFGSWSRVNERLARLETKLQMLVNFTTPKRRENDIDEQ